MNKSASRLVSPVLMWAIIAAGFAASFGYVPALHIFPPSIVGRILLALAMLYWMFFFLGALRVHRKAPVSAAGIDRLVTKGVYASVRHPIYSADMVLAWGIFVAAPQLRILVAVAWLSLVMSVWMKLEEAALTAKFGSEYEQYKRNVPAVFPWLQKK